jgi:hypothetical protein
MEDERRAGTKEKEGPRFEEKRKILFWLKKRF